MSEEIILVVDDEPDIRQVVKDVLEDENYAVLTAASAADASRLQQEHQIDLVLLDIWMPGTDGISLLKEWSDQQGVDIPVIMISGHGNVETAVEAIRYGAYDFLEKPLSTAKLLVTVERALQSANLRKENFRLRGHLHSASRLIGKSQVIRELNDLVTRTAATDSTVLICGEPGSGKSVCARLLHSESERRDKPLIEFSVASISGENLAAQLFGAERNGDVQPGRFEEAQGGTLVLDQINAANMEVQKKLTRTLEEGAFVRVGGQRYIDTNVRIIATTNRELPPLIRDGKFSEDLYYRLNVVYLNVPPLRDHAEDIPELTEHCVNWMVENEQLPYRRFSIGALNALRYYQWPGNVRELRNLIQRLLILNKDVDVDRDEVESALSTGTPNATEQWFPEFMLDLPLRDARDMFERSYLMFRLREVHGSVSELAPLVGMERTHLYRKLKSLDIDPKSVKRSAKS